MACDVLVVGDGPAGCVAGATLAEQGARVWMLGGSPLQTASEQAGQCLPPAGTTWLKQLGLYDEFSRGGHLPIVAHRSVWGAPTEHALDMIHGAHGNAHVLRRGVFDALLRKHAEAKGVTHRADTALRDLQWGGACWRACLDTPSAVTLEPRLVVDATGRRALVARNAGGRVVRDDRLVGVVGRFESEGETDQDQTTLVEAVEDGWLFTVRTGERARVVVLFTDADLLSRRGGKGPHALSSSLAKAGALAETLRGHGYRQTGVSATVPANSGRLLEPIGPGWMAVGDAACAYDPLSGHGLIAAMDSARLGARAAVAHVRGDGGAVREYGQVMAAGYERYRHELRKNYAVEQRFLQSPFWQRRGTAARAA